jgi:hypothetical protein
LPTFSHPLTKKLLTTYLDVPWCFGQEEQAMAGFIVLQDGRAYAASNWGFDRTVAAIAAVLSERKESQALAEWLMQQSSEIVGMGMGKVDIRELTAQNRELFINAVREAFKRAEAQDLGGWYDPQLFPSWLGRFQDLVTMLDSIERGEPPATFNPHMRDVCKPSGEHSGPGWDSASQDDVFGRDAKEIEQGRGASD